MKIFVIVGYNSDMADSVSTWLVKAFRSDDEAQTYLKKLEIETKAISEKVFKIENDYHSDYDAEEPFNEARFDEYMKAKKDFAKSSSMDRNLSFDEGYYVAYEIHSIELEFEP
jgi:hypothetical protein